MEGTTDNTVFVDVFGGGMNVVSEIPLKNKLANDINRYIISLWKHLQKHKVKGERLLPLINDHVTEDEYHSVKVSFLNETTKGKYLSDNSLCNNRITDFAIRSKSSTALSE